MCDLIDLNSPDAKRSLGPSKLASPLIPVPKNVESSDETNLLVITEKQSESEGNNPFDRVLHETVEYVSKKGDPFEMMLQRALKSKKQRNTDLRTQSVTFADDFTPKSKKRHFKMINKTLDGSFFEDKLNMYNGNEKVEIKKEIDSLDVRNTDVCDNVTVKLLCCKDNDENICVSKQNAKIVVTSAESLESSILNQSAMNDALLETVSKSKKDNDELFLEKDILLKEFALPNDNIKSRSLSQGAGRSPTILSCLNRRSHSVTDNKKISQYDYSNIPSVLEKGFLESKYNEQSIFSTLSNVSSITKLSSVSSSVFSIDTMNHAFLDNNSLKESQEKINTTENTMEMKSKQYDLSDLADKLDKLKCTMNAINSTLSKIEDKSNIMKEKNEQITDDKLIDVEVFLPENSSKEYNKSSNSTASLDSVFTDTNKVKKSIIDEAKMLSKTFEELALRTDSESSVDDLISNNTLWMSELLPAFEDDLIVDNLIELPTSSEENSRIIKNTDKEQSLSNDNVDENSLKQIESQFTDCVKQTVVTSLLTDLRKLIKAENNPEVDKLLDNLENALGSNCKNNTELLVTCLNISNELQSPQKISSDIEKSKVTNTDKSEEESEKISFKEESCNTETLSDGNCKLENTSQTTTISSDNLSVKPSSYKDNDENNLNITNSIKEADINHGKDNQPDEKLAVELLMNLGKLLSGQVEDATTMQLLKCIGKALNVASNNYKIENETQLDNNKMHNIQQITPIKASKSDHDTHSSTLSTKVKHRRSYEKNPKLLEKTARRSISAIQLSPKNMQIRKYRSASEFESRKKRFSSDPGLVGNFANQKNMIPEACNMENAEIQPAIEKKEKSIAISDVKNKLKKRTNIINKRGPMKAVHPVDNMQKGALLGKQTISSQTITPPKSDKTTPSGKIISSTPNSLDNKYNMAKKSARSKPMASSTPDGQNSKASSAQLTSANKKRNFSCDISPVTAYINTSGSDERKDISPKRSKLPTPKKCTTPKMDAFGIPKFLTPPKHNSSFNVNYQRSPQRLNRSLIERRRYSPVYQKKSAEKAQQSPLKENRITAKVKPFNLISKLKQHSTSSCIDKENNYT